MGLPRAGSSVSSRNSATPPGSVIVNDTDDHEDSDDDHEFYWD
jgi:hypothetical protein